MKECIYVAVACVSCVIAHSSRASENCNISASEFTTAFANTISMQLAAIPGQVEYGHLQENGIDFDFHLAVEILPRDQAQYFESGWFPTTDERLRSGLIFDTMEEDDVSLVLRLGKPDTDYLIKYHFRKEGDCYHLVRINNESL